MCMSILFIEHKVANLVNETFHFLLYIYLSVKLL